MVGLANQKKILVRGTEQGVKKLEELIALLDRPTGKVRVESWLVQTTEKDLKDVVKWSVEQETFIVGHSEQNWKYVLARLVSDKKAKVLQTSRSESESNLSFPLVSTSTSTFAVTTQLLITVNDDRTAIVSTIPKVVRTPSDTEVSRSPSVVAKLREGNALVFTVPRLLVRKGAVIIGNAPPLPQAQGRLGLPSVVNPRTQQRGRHSGRLRWRPLPIFIADVIKKFGCAHRNGYDADLLIAISAKPSPKRLTPRRTELIYSPRRHGEHGDVNPIFLLMVHSPCFSVSPWCKSWGDIRYQQIWGVPHRNVSRSPYFVQ